MSGITEDVFASTKGESCYARENLAWYVCGPMTGVPRFNYPLFELVTAFLRLDQGRTVINPAELDSPEMQSYARLSCDGDSALLAKYTKETWGDVLARDVRMIEREVGHFVLLPGWEKSRGARLEIFVGLLVGIQRFWWVLFQGDGAVLLYSADVPTIRQVIRDNMP